MAQGLLDRGPIPRVVGHAPVEAILLVEGDDELLAPQLHGLSLGERSGKRALVGAERLEDGGPQ